MRALRCYNDSVVFNNLVIEALEREIPEGALHVGELVHAVRHFLVQHFDHLWTLVNNNPAYLLWCHAGAVWAQARTAGAEAGGPEEASMVEGRVSVYTATLSETLVSIDGVSELWDDLVTHCGVLSLIDHLECAAWRHMHAEYAGLQAPCYRDLSTACARLVCMRREHLAYTHMARTALQAVCVLGVRSSAVRRVADRVRAVLKEGADDDYRQVRADDEEAGSMRDMAAGLMCRPGDVHRIGVQQSSRPTPVGAAYASRTIVPSTCARVIQTFAAHIASRCDMCGDCIVPRASLWEAYMRGPTRVCPDTRGLPILMHVSDHAWFVVLEERVSLHDSVEEALVEWVLRTQGTVVV